LGCAGFVYLLVVNLILSGLIVAGLFALVKPP